MWKHSGKQRQFKSFKRDNAWLLTKTWSTNVKADLHTTIQYVTLSYLRSKEFQRINLQCMPQHRETSKCIPVYTEMYHGKIVALLKEQATFIKASIVLITSVCFIQAQTTIDCGNESMHMWWIQMFPEEPAKWRHSGVLVILQVGKYLLKGEN